MDNKKDTSAHRQHHMMTTREPDYHKNKSESGLPSINYPNRSPIVESSPNSELELSAV